MYCKKARTASNINKKEATGACIVCVTLSSCVCIL